MKFIKENKVAVLSILAIALMFGLLAVPGFAHLGPNGNTYDKFISGYALFFNTTVLSEATKTTYGTGIVGAGVAIIVMSALAIVSFCLSKKSSFFVLLGGIFVLVNSILFFSMEACAGTVYTTYDSKYTICGWVNYVVAAILMLAALYAIYVAIKMMKDEIKHPKQSGPSYNYLKK